MIVLVETGPETRAEERPEASRSRGTSSNVPLLVAGSVAVRSMRTTFGGSATIGMARREVRTLLPEYILSPRHAMQCRAGKGGDASHTRTLASGMGVALSSYSLSICS